MVQKFKNINKYKIFAGLLGALYSLGFAPFSLWYVSLLALSGLFLFFVKAKTAKRAFSFGVIFGVSHYITSIYWLVSSFYMTLESWPLAILTGGLAVVLLSFYLSLYIGAVGFAVKKCSEKAKRILPVVFAGAWVLGEFVRSLLIPAFSWNLAGYNLAYQEETLQLASLGGVYLLSAFFVFVAGCLFYSKRWAFVSIILCTIVYAFGYDRLARQNPTDVLTPNVDKVHIRLVSGNVKQLDKWQPHKKKMALNTYIEASNTGEGVPDIVIWPETSAAYFLNKSEGLRRYLTENLTAEILIVGAPYKNKHGDYYNSLYAIAGDGDMDYRYDKRELVPFGEYFPYRAYFPAFFERFLQGQGDYTSGAMTQGDFYLKNKRFAPLICGEVVLPWLSKYVSEGADYVINVTNDAWFEGMSTPHQLLSFAKVQAVSLGKPFIRVGNYGHNAFIDHLGRILFVEPADSKKINDIYL